MVLTYLPHGANAHGSEIASWRGCVWRGAKHNFGRGSCPHGYL